MRTIFVFALICLFAVYSHAQSLVPFVIPAEIDPQSELAIKDFVPIVLEGPRLVCSNGPITSLPAPGHKAVQPKWAINTPAHQSGFFSVQEKRVRLWGVNLSFSANFPTHADAPKIAKRLAATGVNSVRFHHMDTANWPRGLWDPEKPTNFSREALDRLDFFINELAQRGIWINLNLHVGRAHSNYLDIPTAKRKYDKITNLFTPALIQAQKDFATRLLRHRNPYRESIRYAEDPAIAIVEITNENSFFMWDGDTTLRNLGPYYANLLQTQFNAWLKQRYPSRTALEKAWAQGTEALGENCLKASRFNQKPGMSLPAPWRLEQHGQARSQLRFQASPPHDSVLHIHPKQADGTGWHLQMNQPNLRIEAGRYYTVFITAKSERERTIHCSIGQAHSPWQNLGLNRTLTLTNQWQTFRLGFPATGNDINARVNLSFGDSPLPFSLAEIRLHSGGQTGLLDHESRERGTVQLFQDQESKARSQDRLVFLAETEKAFFNQMYTHIKETLQCKALVTGTIVFGPLGLYAQSDMDFIDSHAYWQHPHFPGKPWDLGNWRIAQKAMSAHPHDATLFRLAAERLAGKPYTVSEYNHPAPLDSQAETVPMIASFGAAQDWDGIWFYTYSHSQDEWNREHLNSFFDIDTNPAKWGFMRAGSTLFREGGFGRLGSRALVPISNQSGELIPRLANRHLQFGSDLFECLADTYNTGKSNLLALQIAASLAEKTDIYSLDTEAPTLQWIENEGKGFYGGEGPQGLVLTGNRDLIQTLSGGMVQITAPDQVTLTMTALDQQNLESSQRILITLCGRCENTNMIFSAKRDTVGRQWGQAPVRIETVTGTIQLPNGHWTVKALSPNGTPTQKATVKSTRQGTTLFMSPQHQTMWYLATRK